jgi:hypothetical protein
MGLEVSLRCGLGVKDIPLAPILGSTVADIELALDTSTEAARF